MKKIIMLLLSIVTVGFIFLNIANAKSESDLFILANILAEEQIDIDKWSFYARERLETSGREERLKILMNQYPEWNWEKREDDEKWEAVGVLITEMGVSEKISLLSSEGHSYLIYEVHGNVWNDRVKKLLERQMYPKVHSILHEKAIIFSCVYSELDGNMYESVSPNVTRFLQSFQAKEIETLRESNFVSTTAYSPLLSESIKSETEEINLQLGLRNQGLGGKTILVVGTPILTIEY